MKADLLLWLIFLIIAILFSSFLHEVGHGLSAKIKGQPVSTGFNKVGDFNKRPGNSDFRKEHKHYKNPWDLGPFLTLTLAVLFTCLSFQVQNRFLIFLCGSMAFANSFLRLIPMLRSYYILITTGNFALEDEIAMGTLWYQMSGIIILKYIPSLVSIVVSIICLRYIIKALQIKLPSLFAYTWTFTIVSVGALIAALPILNFLDQHIRINWG